MVGFMRHEIIAMSKKYKYITRLDYNHTHAWQVRICYKSGFTTHSKLFSDGVQGSKTKALKAAIKFRNQLCKDLGITELLKYKNIKPGPKNHNKRNASGIIGVSLDIAKRNGNINMSWTASYCINNKQIHRRFSIAKYSEKQAFRLACAKRYEYCGALKVYRGVKMPYKIIVPFEYVD